MPGGRVQPVILVKRVDLQKQKLLDDTKRVQLEEARQRTITAQQVMREEQDRVAAELHMKNDKTLRAAHESKLAESSGSSDMKSQQDADEELKRWQLAGLVVEKQRKVDAAAAPLDDSINSDAELAAIRDRISSILNSDLTAPVV